MATLSELKGQGGRIIVKAPRVHNGGQEAIDAAGGMVYLRDKDSDELLLVVPFDELSAVADFICRTEPAE